MFYLVYKTTNLINGKFYIGAHRTEDKDDDYLGSGIYLNRAIKKYGKANFKREILCECVDSKEMFAKEIELVVLNVDISYNLCKGGVGGNLGGTPWNKGRPMTTPHWNTGRRGGNGWPKGKPRDPTTQEKLRIARRGIPPANKGKKGLQVAWNKGKHTLPEEQRLRMVAALRKKGTWNKGKPWSTEIRKKLSESHKGQIQSEESRRKNSEWHKGKKKSPETRAKMKEAQRLRNEIRQAAKMAALLPRQ